MKLENSVLFLHIINPEGLNIACRSFFIFSKNRFSVETKKTSVGVVFFLLEKYFFTKLLWH